MMPSAARLLPSYRSLLACGLQLLVAAPALAATGGGEDAGLSQHLWPAVNLLLLLGILVYFGREPIQNFFSDRRRTIQDDLDGAARELESAERRHAELERKLADLEAELTRIRETAARRAEQESDRILADARAAAERIKSDAREAVAQESRRAEQELRHQAAELALELAANQLKEQVTDDDRDRLLDEFIARIEREGTGPAA